VARNNSHSDAFNQIAEPANNEREEWWWTKSVRRESVSAGCESDGRTPSYSARGRIRRGRIAGRALERLAVAEG
jgi:hypothetical protein